MNNTKRVYGKCEENSQEYFEWEGNGVNNCCPALLVGRGNDEAQGKKIHFEALMLTFCDLLLIS